MNHADRRAQRSRSIAHSFQILMSDCSGPCERLSLRGTERVAMCSFLAALLEGFRGTQVTSSLRGGSFRRLKGCRADGHGGEHCY